MLYSTDLLAGDVAQGVSQLLAMRTSEPHRQEILDYAIRLGEAVVGHRDEIDTIIAQCAQGWTLERMPAVDRALLRVATAELMDISETPTAVIIAEAGKLASQYSTENSRSFIQGVLGAVAKHVRP